MRSTASPLPILFALAVSGCASLPAANHEVARAAESGAHPTTRPAAAPPIPVRATARPVKMSTTRHPIPPTPAAPRRTERARAAPPAAVAQATTPRPHTDGTTMAGVYIYRHETFGAAVSMAVEMDGNPLGSTGAKTFLYVAAAPGRHVITTRAENADHLEIDVVAGERYYVWQAVEIGERYARTRLQRVDEPTGQAAVADCLPAAGARLIALD